MAVVFWTLPSTIFEWNWIAVESCVVSLAMAFAAAAVVLRRRGFRAVLVALALQLAQLLHEAAYSLWVTVKMTGAVPSRLRDILGADALRQMNGDLWKDFWGPFAKSIAVDLGLIALIFWLAWGERQRNEDRAEAR
jgi:hypothetical protein